MQITCSWCHKPYEKTYFIVKKLRNGPLFCSRHCNMMARHAKLGNGRQRCKICQAPIHRGYVHCKACLAAGKDRAHHCLGCSAPVNSSAKWCPTCRADGTKAKAHQRKCCNCENLVPARTKRVFCDACVDSGKSLPGGSRIAGQILGDLRRGQLKNRWDAALRANARKRMKNRVYACAVPGCEYNHHLHTSHIRAVKDFPDSATIEEVNSVENLVYLCPNHHWDMDHGRLDLVLLST